MKAESGLGLRPFPAALGLLTAGVVLLGTTLVTGVRAAPAQAGSSDSLSILRPVLTPAESALVEAAGELRGGVQAATVERLRQLSRDHAGDEISGLSQVLVARASLSLGRFDEAAAAARHPDIDLTLIGDRALLFLAQAKARAADYSASASAYLRAVDAARSDDVGCTARLGAAAALKRINQNARRVTLLAQSVEVCGRDQANVLLDLGEALLDEGSPVEALARFEAIERDYPTSPQALTAAARIFKLVGLSGSHPNRSARQDFERRFARAKALLRGGQRNAAIKELRSLKVHKARGEDAAEVLVTLGQALSRTASREAKTLLAGVPDTSPFNADASLHLARLAPATERAARLREVVASFPGSPAAEQALYSLATFFQKDALHSQAAPYYQKLVEDFADGTYAEAAAMRSAFEALRFGRSQDAAATLEVMARRARSPAGFLYWAGIARLRNGETERAATLLRETADRFRNTWYGTLASGELERLPDGAAAARASVTALGPDRPRDDLPGPLKARLRQLLLVDFSKDALDELLDLGNTSAALAARALIESDRGELRNAIIHMKRAHPEYVSARIQDLPDHVWQTIYPLKHTQALVKASLNERLDPALVAALVCQESTFDERAKSVAGARGLMQIMPTTGRPLARQLGEPYQLKMLNVPETSLRFGTRYFRQMLDRFDSRPEAALAAYNAGPHRVKRWLAPNPDIRTDEFAESIPFSETRTYVMIILGARDQYRRIYGLEPTPQPGS